MSARHAVLLTPLECAVPKYIPISILNASVTPLESAHTDHSQLAENTATLSPVECAVTRFPSASSLESALTKTLGVGGYTSHSGSSSPRAKRVRCAPDDFAAPRDLSPICSSSFFSCSCALFCTHQKLNPFVYKRFRTLSQKHPGVGVPYPERISRRAPPFLCYHPASHPRRRCEL
jgi:hypothetical protein